jgi:hypothetical protein
MGTSRKIAFVHTVFPAFGIFDPLVKELLPGDLIVYHITDEILAKVVVAQGRLSPFLYRRVAEHAYAAEQAGAELVQLTCSSISPCADYAAALVSIPVLKIDVPMIDRAFAIGEAHRGGGHRPIGARSVGGTGALARNRAGPSGTGGSRFLRGSVCRALLTRRC